MREALDRSPIGDTSVVALCCGTVSRPPVVARSPDRGTPVVAWPPDRGTGLDRRSPFVQGQGDLRSRQVARSEDRATTRRVARIGPAIAVALAHRSLALLCRVA